MDTLVFDKFFKVFDESQLCNINTVGAPQGPVQFNGVNDVDNTKHKEKVDQTQKTIEELLKLNKDKDAADDGEITLSAPTVVLDKESLKKIAGLFSGAVGDAMMTVMAEIAKAMAEQKRDNRKMRDANAELAVKEKQNQATELQKKASDMMTSAIIKAAVTIAVSAASVIMSVKSLSKSMGALKEAKVAEKASQDAFNQHFEELSGSKTMPEAMDKMKTAAANELNVDVADLPKNTLEKISKDVTEMQKAATEFAKNTVEKSTESIYRGMDAYNKTDGIVNGLSQLTNAGANAAASHWDNLAAQRDVEIKKSEAQEQEFQAVTDNIRQLIDSNKELIDSANRAMQSISDSRVQTMHKVLG